MIETVFVTGGSSTLGQHVLRRLMSHFHVLAMVHRHNLEIPDAEIELLNGGLEETVRHPQALQRAQVVLHMAAVTHVATSNTIADKISRANPMTNNSC